jgi:hypothetical protein
MRGIRLYLCEIRLYVVEDIDSGWQGPVNARCSFGLPVNVAPECILDLLKINSGILPAGRWTLDMIARNNPDWLLAACRIPVKPRSFYKPYFSEFQNLLKIMVSDAGSVPMRSNRLNCRDELASGASEQPNVEINMPALDMVLLSAVNPYIARMLALYWADTDARKGVYYDYRITATWPRGTLWNLEKCIDFESWNVGKRFYNIFHVEGLVFDSPGQGVIIESKPLTLTNAGRGLRYLLTDGPVTIDFTSTVREFCMYASHSAGSVKIEAYSQDTLVDSMILSRPEGILAVHSKSSITSVVIRQVVKITKPPFIINDRLGDIKKPLLGQIEKPVLVRANIIFYKIYAGEKFFDYGTYNYDLYGVCQEKPEPLTVPRGLKATPQSGMSKTLPDGTVLDQRYAAGLSWYIPLSENGCLLSDMPVMYHIQRQTARSAPVLLTSGQPLVVPSQKNAGSDTIFYTDAVSSRDTYEYSVAAVDIWGRVSQYCSWIGVNLTASVPPPPSGAEAKYLDPQDPYLSQLEKSEVAKNNNKPVLRVRWKWNESLQRQAPDVSSFNIYFQPGWLNVVQGSLVTQPAENGMLLDLQTDYFNNRIPAGAFGGLALQMNQAAHEILYSKRAADGRFIFIIRKTIPQKDDFLTCESGTYKISSVVETGSSLQLELVTDLVNVNFGRPNTVTIKQRSYPVQSIGFATGTAAGLILTVPKVYPQKGDFFALPLLPGTPAFVDYTRAGSWQTLLRSEAALPGKEQYEAFIYNPPLYPGEDNKTVYAQIGFSSVNPEGEGSVSGPAAIVAVYREKPPAQVLPDMPGDYTTPADYYGKSRYALRWTKNPAVRYFVHRALDETVFMVDREERMAATAGGVQRISDADAFIDSLGLGLYRNEIKQRVINPGLVDYKSLLMDQHRNVLLKALVNMPGNEKAFVKLNLEAIDSEDANFQNKRNYWEPESLPIDPSLLLFVDDTLDGNSENVIFYRLQTVNELGTAGDYGPSSYPVYLSKTSLVSVPRITGVEGGERRITIKWSPCLETGIAGYLVYRAENERDSEDIRRMKLLKADVSDAYSAVAGTDRFTDTGVDGGKKYYYRVIAAAVIEQKGGDMKIKSPASEVFTGQAFDTAPPEPPMIISLEWVYLDENGAIYPFASPAAAGQKLYTAVRLKWAPPEPGLSILVQYRAGTAADFSNASDWLAEGTAEFTHKNELWYKSFEYRLKAVNRSGNTNKVYHTAQLPAVNP